MAHKALLSCSPWAMMPVLRRLRAIRPRHDFLRPCSSSPASDKARGNYRAVHALDGAHSQRIIDIHIHRTQQQVGMGRHVVSRLLGSAWERAAYGHM